jgi:hypothetical protein
MKEDAINHCEAEHIYSIVMRIDIITFPLRVEGVGTLKVKHWKVIMSRVTRLCEFSHIG